MERLIKWLKEKLISIFRKKGDIVPAGIQVFDEHGETVADLSTGLTKIIWTKELTTIVPEISVKVPIYKGQELFTLREYYGSLNASEHAGDYFSYIDGDTVTFTPVYHNTIGRPCGVKLMIGVCE